MRLLGLKVGDGEYRERFIDKFNVYFELYWSRIAVLLFSLFIVALSWQLYLNPEQIHPVISKEELENLDSLLTDLLDASVEQLALPIDDDHNKGLILNDDKVYDPIDSIDVYFEQGYDLLEKEKEKIRDLIQRTIIIKEHQLKGYSGQKPVIKIVVRGYADQTDFREGTKLVAELLEGVTEKIPEDRIDRRKLLNKILAEKRAKSVIKYINEFILNMNQGDFDFSILHNIAAIGEDAEDPTMQDRFCRVNSYIGFVSEVLDTVYY